MYESEINLLRQFLKVYDGWPHNPECINVADLLRSTISALERLTEIETQAAESK